MDNFLSIGTVAAQTGVKVPTIRYYEQIGLLPAPDRSPANQRRYGADHVAILSFIRHGRALGLEVDAIRDLLALRERPEASCRSADAIVRRHHQAVVERIGRLKALARELEDWLAACPGEKAADCRILESLADPLPPGAGNGAARPAL